LKPDKGTEVKQEGQIKPLARTQGLVIKELPTELLVYDLERHKAHCLNPTASLVWKECDGAQTVFEIARGLEEKVGSGMDEDVVLLALDQLAKANLLKEKPAVKGGVSRRELLRKGAIAAAVVLPLVTSLVAPTAYAAASCSSLSCSGAIPECTLSTACHCTGGPTGGGVCVPN
jgi:hypothetical protein